MAADPHASGGSAPPKRRGRPVGTGKPPGERTQVRSVRLPEWLWQWLETQPGGVTPTIRRIAEDAAHGETT